MHSDDGVDDLATRVSAAQRRARSTWNREANALYLSVGRSLLERPQMATDAVIARLARDLAARFPEQDVWTQRNLLLMVAAAVRWPNAEAMFLECGDAGWDSVVDMLEASKGK